MSHFPSWSFLPYPYPRIKQAYQSLFQTTLSAGELSFLSYADSLTFTFLPKHSFPARTSNFECSGRKLPGSAPLEIGIPFLLSPKHSFPGKKSKPDYPFYLAHITLCLVMRSVHNVHSGYSSLTRWEDISLRKEIRITSITSRKKIGKGYLLKPRLEPTIRYELAFDPKLIFLVMWETLSRGELSRLPLKELDLIFECPGQMKERP